MPRGGVRVGAKEREEGLDSHKVEKRREGAALPDAVFRAGEGAEVTIEVEANGVVVVEHGDDGSKGGVKTEGGPPGGNPN